MRVTNTASTMRCADGDEALLLGAGEREGAGLVIVSSHKKQRLQGTVYRTALKGGRTSVANYTLAK